MTFTNSTTQTSAPTAGSPVRHRDQFPLLTNHGHVLLCIASHGDVRISELARLTGIGERATYRIVSDLVKAGYLSRQRLGRRNKYSINTSVSLRHPLENRFVVSDFVRSEMTSD